VIVEVLVPSAATLVGLAVRVERVALATPDILTRATRSTLTANPTSVVADGTSTSTITMQAKDANGNNLTTGGLIVNMYC
jgi:hypothetical protein